MEVRASVGVRVGAMTRRRPARRLLALLGAIAVITGAASLVAFIWYRGEEAAMVRCMITFAVSFAAVVVVLFVAEKV
jgi:hypothetical protein